MKCKELIEILQKQDPEGIVFVHLFDAGPCGNIRVTNADVDALDEKGTVLIEHKNAILITEA